MIVMKITLSEVTDKERDTTRYSSLAVFLPGWKVNSNRLFGCKDLSINPSPKKVTICASEAKPKQRGEAPVCTRSTIAKGKGDEED
jgi:hypothetical protein